MGMKEKDKDNKMLLISIYFTFYRICTNEVILLLPFEFSLKHKQVEQQLIEIDTSSFIHQTF